MSRAYIGMGSNIGDRMEYLRAGLKALLAAAPELIVVGTSSVYESEPVGMTDQDDFYNAAVAVETTLSPHELLRLLHEIEVDNGRQRLTRWGPRTLDLDILLFSDVAMDDPDLTIPHPRMADRRFALEPIVEIDPGAELPDGRSVSGLLEALGDEQVIWRIGEL